MESGRNQEQCFSTGGLQSHSDVVKGRRGNSMLKANNAMPLTIQMSKVPDQ